jgi:hypothetical protein
MQPFSSYKMCANGHCFLELCLEWVVLGNVRLGYGGLQLFVKLVRCQVVVDCSFHVVTRYHESSLLPFSLKLSFLLMFHHTSLILTFGHALTRFATIRYCLLSWFSARSYLRFSRCHSLSRFVTLCHGLWYVLTLGS